MKTPVGVGKLWQGLIFVPQKEGETEFKFLQTLLKVLIQ